MIRAGDPFEIVERPLPTPGQGAVRIAVQACGTCHRDTLTKDGGFPGLVHPRVPGHAVAGVAGGGGVAPLHPSRRRAAPPAATGAAATA